MKWSYDFGKQSMSLEIPLTSVAQSGAPQPFSPDRPAPHADSVPQRVWRSGSPIAAAAHPTQTTESSSQPTTPTSHGDPQWSMNPVCQARTGKTYCYTVYNHIAEHHWCFYTQRFCQDQWQSTGCGHVDYQTAPLANGVPLWKGASLCSNATRSTSKWPSRLELPHLSDRQHCNTGSICCVMPCAVKYLELPSRFFALEMGNKAVGTWESPGNLGPAPGVTVTAKVLVCCGCYSLLVFVDVCWCLFMFVDVCWYCWCLLGPRMSSLLAFLQHTQYLSVQYQLDPLAHLNLDTKHRCVCWIVWIFNEYAIYIYIYMQYMHECLDHWASARLGGFNKDLCVDDLSARSPVHSEMSSSEQLGPAEWRSTERSESHWRSENLTHDTTS